MQLLLNRLLIGFSFGLLSIFPSLSYQKAVEAKARKMEKLAEKAGRGGGAAGSTRGGAAGARGGAAASARGGARASLSNQRWQINKNVRLGRLAYLVDLLLL